MAEIINYQYWVGGDVFLNEKEFEEWEKSHQRIPKKNPENDGISEERPFIPYDEDDDLLMAQITGVAVN